MLPTNDLPCLALGGNIHHQCSLAVQRGYNERLQAIQRQQSLALNQLQQASMSRAESFLGAAELLSQAAAAASMPAPNGLPPLAFGNAGSYDHALNSPMTPQPQVCPAAGVAAMEASGLHQLCT